jgi:hypothetical protein
MKTRIMLLNIVFLLSMAGICQAQETKKGKLEADANAMPVIKYLWYGFDLLDIRRGLEGKISVDVSATVQSKHMWHGIDLLDDHGVVIPTAGITLGDTGFSGKVIGGYCLSSGFSNSRDFHYAAFYSGDFLKDTPYATNFVTNYFYYGKPELAKRKNDSQEIGTTFFWPRLIKAGNGYITPSYYLGYIWASRSNSNIRGCEGFIHVFGLGYDFEIPNFWPKGEKQAFKLSGDITYNDGFAGSAIEHDWSHATLGISTDFKKGNLTITPFLNYQISMEDTVNNEDELWCGVNTTYRF